MRIAVSPIGENFGGAESSAKGLVRKELSH